MTIQELNISSMLSVVAVVMVIVLYAQIMDFFG